MYHDTRPGTGLIWTLPHKRSTKNWKDSEPRINYFLPPFGSTLDLKKGRDFQKLNNRIGGGNSVTTTQDKTKSVSIP